MTKHEALRLAGKHLERGVLLSVEDLDSEAQSFVLRVEGSRGITFAELEALSKAFRTTFIDLVNHDKVMSGGSTWTGVWTHADGYLGISIAKIPDEVWYHQNTG